MEARFIFLITFHLLTFLTSVSSTVVTTTTTLSNPAKVFSDKPFHPGSLAAIVDINGDRGSDLILINENSQSLEILISQTKQVRTNQLIHYETVTLGRKGARGVVPADFNNDKMMDLLVTFAHESNPLLFDVWIYWGDRNGNWHWHTDNCFKSNNTLADQPLLVEANGDGISDLFVVLENSTRQFWLGNTYIEGIGVSWDFSYRPFTVSPHSADSYQGEMFTPQANAIVAYGEFSDAHLMLTTKDKSDSSKLVIEAWKGTPKGLYKIDSIHIYSNDNNDTFISSEYTVGRSTYCDFNGDGKIDLMVPVCKLKDNKCTDSKIYVMINGVWSPAFMGNEQWNFIYNIEINGRQQPINLVTGDFNHDGIVDVVTTMGSNQHSQSVVLLGSECTDLWCKSAGRSLRMGVMVRSPDSDKSNTVMSTMTDVNDDGSLDILTTEVVPGKDGGPAEVVTRAYLNKLTIDHCFLNVMVLAQSKLKSPLFFNPLPGATVICHTTDLAGNAQVSKMTQLTQTAYNSLQPPYMDFGLGLLPNFVDSIELQVPSPLLPAVDVEMMGYREAPINGSYPIHRKSWKMLIPNSQVVILPNPSDSPSSWTIQILVTPSRYFMLTLIVFVSVCVVVTLGIAALHCLEMRSDQRERVLQKHHFHFDAM